MSELGSSVGDDGQQEGDALAVWRSPEFLAGYYARDRDDGGAHLAEPHLDQAGIMVDPATEARRRSIAARPVPPVVPDSDGEVQPLDLSDDERTGLLTALDELHGPNGSGVVPDKLALAPAFHCDNCGSNTHDYLACGPMPVRVVPAVTDDEAAERVISLALNDNPVALNDLDLNELALDVVAALRSAGFLIVHHTKET